MPSVLLAKSLHEIHRNTPNIFALQSNNDAKHVDAPQRLDMPLTHFKHLALNVCLPYTTPREGTLLSTMLVINEVSLQERYDASYIVILHI